MPMLVNAYAIETTEMTILVDANGTEHSYTNGRNVYITHIYTHTQAGKHSSTQKHTTDCAYMYYLNTRITTT